METGQVSQTDSSQIKTDNLVKRFEELRKLKEKKLQEKAARERDVQTATLAMKEVVTELKQQGINSTEELRNRIESLQVELDEELTSLFKSLEEVELHENRNQETDNADFIG